MKNAFAGFLIICLIHLPCLSQSIPFQKGVNLPDYYMVSQAGQIPYSEQIQRDFQNIYSLGCDVIRLPVDLYALCRQELNYSLDPLFLYFLDRTIEEAQKQNLHLILDFHRFQDTGLSPWQLQTFLNAVWTELAQRYLNRYPRLYFELMNEPYEFSAEQWGTIQGEIIQTIRQIDTERLLILGGAPWNSAESLLSLPEYTEKGLIYTFHYYEPFLFTHQGADWITPGLKSLSGIPFPPEAGEIPVLPQDLKDSWVEGALKVYSQQASIEQLMVPLDQAVEFRRQRNVPVFCGEWGVYIPNSDAGQRIQWYRQIGQALKEREIPWTLWNYRDHFGLFTNPQTTQFPEDLNTPLLKVLDLNQPAPKEDSGSWKSFPMTLYDQGLAYFLKDNGFHQNAVIHYFEGFPAHSDCYLSWTGGARYSTIRWEFPQPMAFTEEQIDSLSLQMDLAGSQAGIAIEIRFVNSSTEDRLPWRMAFRVETKDPGESWVHLSIPLRSFQESGAWKDRWYSQKGEFDWSSIAAVEMAADYHSLEGLQLKIDNIEIR